LIVLVLALLPRVLDLGGFVTLDEVNFWMPRSQRFLEALHTGDFAATAIKPHPGVTTMWLGSVGILLRRALVAWGMVEEISFPLRLALMRLPLALVHTGGILAGYALLRRMLPATVALLAAVLWAADPFVIGYSRLLHVDGLQTTFATLSLLAACVYWHHTPRPGFLVLSAVCAALAALSKVPGLAVLPVVGLIALGSRFPVHRGSFLVLGAQLLAWGGVFALTLALVWPAVWADLPRVAELFRASITEEGGQPHAWGNFFMGRAVEAPGPLFYPVALALRLTPWTLAGVLLLPLAWRWLDLSPASRRDLLALTGFVLLFTAVLSLSPKKFDRYLVPVFPALDVLAAVGIVGSLTWLLRTIGQWSGSRGLWIGTGLVALLAALNVVWWHPYAIVAYNQALGGAPMGARIFSVAWGEGLGEAADWLNQQPDITGVVVASTMYNTFQPYLRHGAQAVAEGGETLPDNTGYVMVYLRSTQRGMLWSPYDQFYPEQEPLHTVTIHGVDYAWIYQVPPPISHTLEVNFGPHISLKGYELDSSALRQTGTLSLTVQWQTSAPLDENYMLFAHVLDSSGQRVGQTDAPPAGPNAPTSTWQPERVMTWTHPVLLPPNLPPGDYWLALGLYRPGDFARLPVQGATVPPDAPGDTQNALLLPLEVQE
jgi:4-amino-4-deoxy-L-arabinose transferase-like glycosyltransferase